MFQLKKKQYVFNVKMVKMSSNMTTGKLEYVKDLFKNIYKK